MAVANLTFKITNVEIGSILVDVSEEEMHTTTVETTDSPVERGADVTDHVRQKPDTLKIVGVVTDTPFQSSGVAPVPQTISLPNGQQFVYQSQSTFVAGRAENTYALLRNLETSGTLITITTALRVYTNMIMTSLEVPRTARIGRALRFTATFKQIQIVQNATVEKPAIPKMNTNTNEGKKTPQPVQSSIALKLVQTISGNQAVLQ